MLPYDSIAIIEWERIPSTSTELRHQTWNLLKSYYKWKVYYVLKRRKYKKIQNKNKNRNFQGHQLHICVEVVVHAWRNHKTKTHACSACVIITRPSLSKIMLLCPGKVKYTVHLLCNWSAVVVLPVLLRLYLWSFDSESEFVILILGDWQLYILGSWIQTICRLSTLSLNILYNCCIYWLNLRTRRLSHLLSRRGIGNKNLWLDEFTGILDLYNTYT